jgi:glycosyltransferase involved in cell wall biosynthesis
MDTPERAPISAIVLTYNEEANIEFCLDSVADLYDELILVDSGSTDATVAICKKYTNQVYTHQFVDSASQWNWALKNLPIANEWVLPLDADHRISELLKREIREAVQSGDPTVDGYYGRHKYLFMGCPIRGFKPYSLRLFRRSRTHLDDSELVDFRFVVQGRTAKLSGFTYEENRKESSIDFWIDKHQKFSSRLATEEVLRRSGQVKWNMQPRLLGNPDERVLWMRERWYDSPLYIRSLVYFFYRYFLRLGFLDGRIGLFYHVMQALWFRLIIDAKITELEQRIARAEVSMEQLANCFSHKF